MTETKLEAAAAAEDRRLQAEETAVLASVNGGYAATKSWLKRHALQLISALTFLILIGVIVIVCRHR